MAIVTPLTAESSLLSYLLSTQSLILKLFTNDITPDQNTVLTGVTEATQQAGYAEITLAGGGWTITQPSGVTTGTHSEQTFTFTTAVNAYGYYLVNTGGALQWIERFSGAPFTLPSGGGQINITPKLTLS